jgi:hypothetical protein
MVPEGSIERASLRDIRIINYKPHIFCCAPSILCKKRNRNMRKKCTTITEVNKTKIAFTNKPMTAYGGFSLLAAFFEKIGLKEMIDTNSLSTIKDTKRESIFFCGHRGRTGTLPSAGYPYDLLRVATAASAAYGPDRVACSSEQVRGLSGSESLQG